MASKNSNNIFILESNPTRRDYLKSTISQLGYTPISFDRETICLDNLSPLNPNLVISGSLSVERTFRFINALKMRSNGVRMLVLSDESEIQEFININGFDDIVLLKASIGPSEIKKAINDVRNTRLKNKLFQKHPLIVGKSPEMIKIKRMISELRESADTVLIQGEPGTGKELVARAIHCLSSRRDNPFVKVRVSGLSSEWFGYKGINPGRVIQKKKGIFELAERGTIFLDRIEKAPASFQAKMLQILDGGVGSDIKHNLDVRIVATVRENLSMLKRKTDFRKDLFYRLNVINIKIPPLKNRTEDIPLLVDFFNDRFCCEFGKCYGDISEKIKGMLSLYHWPGNVRELKNVIKNMVLTADKTNTSTILIENNQHDEYHKFTHYEQDFSAIPDLSNIKRYLKDLNKISLKDIQKEFIERAEKKLMKEALAKTNWNRKKASILLDISYKSMLNKIKAYNIS